MKQDEVIRHELRNETACETRKKLEELGVKSPSGVTVSAGGRTSIVIKVPDHLEGDEREAFIQARIEKFVNRYKGKIL